MKAERSENQPYDAYEIGGKRVMFNSDWKAQKLSKEEYMKAFTAGDERYSQLLSALLDQLKKTS